jgi:hypothetical protein
VDSPHCDCGQGKQTVEHLFVHCPNLTAARSELRALLNHTDVNALLTGHADMGTEWALVHFGLEQFNLAKVAIGSRFFEK